MLKILEKKFKETVSVGFLTHLLKMNNVTPFSQFERTADIAKDGNLLAKFQLKNFSQLINGIEDKHYNLIGTANVVLPSTYSHVCLCDISFMIRKISTIKLNLLEPDH